MQLILVPCPSCNGRNLFGIDEELICRFCGEEIDPMEVFEKANKRIKKGEDI